MSSAGEEAGSSNSDETVASGESQTKKRKLHSQRSQIHSFVRFVNVTERRVNVVWLNYEGECVHYKTLQPQHFVDVNTFVGHPWIFQDADTGDKLVVQLKEVYQPIGFSMKADGWPPQRKIVKISVPVYSLAARCMQVLRDTVPSDQVNRLEIPELLKQGISELVAVKQGTAARPGT